MAEIRIAPSLGHRGTGVRACEEQLRYLGLGSVYHDSSSSLTPPAARVALRIRLTITPESEAHRPTPTSRLGCIRTYRLSTYLSDIRIYPLDVRCSTLASSAALSRARNKCRTAPRLLTTVLVLALYQYVLVSRVVLALPLTSTLLLPLHSTYLSSSSTTYPAHTATPRTARRPTRVLTMSTLSDFSTSSSPGSPLHPLLLISPALYHSGLPPHASPAYAIRGVTSRTHYQIYCSTASRS